MKSQSNRRSCISLGAGAALLIGLLSQSGAKADYQSEVLSDGPVAYFRLSESILAPSVSYLTNQGTAGTAAQGRYTGEEATMKQQPGAISGNAATHFDGSSQYAIIPTGSPINIAPPFTIEAWVKPDTTRASGSLVSPVGNLYRSGNNAKGWLFYQDADGWNYRHGDSGGYKVNIKGGGAPVVGQWHHLVATYDGTETKLYVNGQPGPTSAASTYEPNAEVPMGIGARGDAGFLFPGAVDDVAIYPSVLSASAIAGHYDAATTNAAGYGAMVLSQNPVGYWRMDEPVYVFPKAANSGVLGTAADGDYRGGATSVAGPQPPAFPGFEANNSAGSFDGTNGIVRIPAAGNLTAPDLKSVPEATILAWVKPNEAQVSYKGIFAKRPLSDGLYLNGDDTLNYSWNDAANTWGFNSALVPPPGEWSMAAVVVRPESSTFYIQSATGGFASAVNTVTHGPADFTSGPWALANDINYAGTERYFYGSIDEAALFNKALNEGRIRTYFMAASGVTAAPVFVSDQPVLTPQGTIYSTTTFKIDVDVYGTPPLGFQWRKDGGAISGATLATFVKSNAAATDNGNYDVIVSNGSGSVTSAVVAVVINAAVPPVITQEPVSTTRYVGATASFSVAASGTEPFTYQWKLGGASIANQTNATLVITNIGSANAGSYSVVVGNVAGNANSASATLTLKTTTPDSYESTVVSMRPVAYWRLNEQNGTYVARDYAGGYDATQNASVVNGAQGPRPPTFPGLETGNTASTLNGADTEISSGVSLVNNRAQFTILGWFRSTGPQPATSGRVGLFGQNDVAEFGYHGLGTIGIWTPTGGFASFGSAAVKVGEWYFITATADGKALTLYLNGKQVAQAQATTANYGNSSAPFNMGYAVLDATGNYFLGDVDEVAFFDRALSAAEILALNSKATGVEFKVVEESSSAAVMDTKPSGTRYDGYNNGAVWLASSADAANVTRSGVMQFNPTNGPTQVVVPYASAFNTTEGTMTFWMRSAGNTDTNGNEAAMLIDRRTTIGDVIVMQDAGTLFWQPNWIYGQSSTAVVSDDKWHHVAYVYDQVSTVSLYIDGVLDSSQTSSTTWNWPAAPMEMGLSHDAYWRAYDGYLDDVRVYNRKLTDPEIAQVYAGDAASVVAAGDLVGRYNFDTAPSGLVITLTWPLGVLESADKAEGPYSAVAGATSPYTVVNPTGSKFYRAKL